MHSKPCLPEGHRGPVAVLDSIHGAQVIAESLIQQGVEAEALEVYHHSQDMQRYSLVAAPVHLSSANPALVQARQLKKRVITHHRMVGSLLADEEAFTSFEVTGTRGKTTTALLLARMLSFSGRAISHTTRGIELWENGRASTISSGLSITPANVLLAHRSASLQKADFLVSEVSLGGTGAADCGILTSLEQDYLIAGGGLWASTAKLQMMSLSRPGSALVAGIDTRISADLSFGDGGDVQSTPSSLRWRQRTAPLRLGDGFDPQAYLSSIAAAAAAVIRTGHDLDQAALALEGFDGWEGRMKSFCQDGVTILDNSNSGLKAEGVAAALREVPPGGSLCLVVGEEAQTVCEGMDISALMEVLRAARPHLDGLVLVGSRLRSHADELRAQCAADLRTGLALAKESLGPGDRLVSCVKCFR
ncbi:MAG: UDP-N-acetylmuramate--L-alanine ligase [Methanosaeta sp. PtaB.Bin039]|nr:MAG: UDP-N-acetylmuramate--L-alanine ligase [Methanosaeta sp. PtaB.Bin039]